MSGSPEEPYGFRSQMPSPAQLWERMEGHDPEGEKYLEGRSLSRAVELGLVRFDSGSGYRVVVPMYGPKEPHTIMTLQARAIADDVPKNDRQRSLFGVKYSDHGAAMGKVCDAPEGPLRSPCRAILGPNRMSRKGKNPGPRGSADSRKKEAARLHEWCRVVLDTMAELHPEMTLRASLMYGLDVALREGKVGALRIATKDMLEWVHGLKPGDRARIDQALRSKFGTGLAEDLRAIGREVKAIVERGTIDDDDECRLLRSWVEMIAGDPKKRSELDAINKLMERFLTGRG